MAESRSGVSRNTLRLIWIPAVITLAITLVRLLGELKHWPAPWFVASAGGGGAIIGIAWLPIIFGPYFALKLKNRGQGPESNGKAIGFSILGLVVLAFGGFLAFSGGEIQISGKTLIAFIIMLIAAFVPWAGWGSLTKTLVAYAYSARIPVIIVMFFALRGQWGTHYDALPPGYPAGAAFWPKYVELALLPQLMFWIGYTVILASIIGTITAALVRRKKPALSEASS
ncbi:MAG TPA: hypothetical protein VFZ08_05960 [Terriglobia bacterium]|nr:hypothetical protein [Terriglobia bacterium]